MTGKTDGLDPAFVAELEAMETEAGFPFVVTSGVRTPSRNLVVGGVEQSAHKEKPCVCADIEILTSHQRYTIMGIAYQRGFRRIGDGKNFIHLDRSTKLPQDVLWNYYPKPKP